ncbi:MAG TPA: aldehyde dehydrogenase [Bacteroidales bacterium]|jgi:hypothetical protein|nr:aldehyde dehydrogenase [Bacteroidales bacterium]HOS71637.1 aldehyde dehydrogenase [Bacteroidales bacterium]HQH25396.1 aldehyde dehydrogenase [Bacteroidales bacterium]HQJ83182.1 aldehyde dehydrogenase [Bacteroidales bacterium]
MKLAERIETFASLGESLRDALAGKQTGHSRRLNELIEKQYLKNPWFTPPGVRLAVSAIASELVHDRLSHWCSAYPALDEEITPANVGVVMAGNIPLAGFHDFLSILISGNRIIAKKSSKDPDLIELIADIVISLNPAFGTMISLTEDRLSGFDMIIATGSDNSARYFEYYFGRYPHIIRRNRNSIAIIDGTESKGELRELGNDVFSYFGLGCRNVSLVFLPEGYDIRDIISVWHEFSSAGNHNKYAGNYDFHKAVFLVNRQEFTDTGFLLLKEDNSLSSPVSVLHYSFYKTAEELQSWISTRKDKIQCITGHGHVPFGRSQMPALWDYADGVDTIEFLLKKKQRGIL